MAELNRSDDTTNLGPGQLAISQGQFRGQQDVIGDSLLQLGGKGNVTPGFEQNDPLNAPFVLYVNPYIGKDDIAFGSYANDTTETVDAELKRIESQRLVCGYTEAAPFKTINRAVIEAGLITSKSYLSAGTVPFQRVCIVMAPSAADVICGPGVAASAVTAYDPSTDVVDAAYLQQFNPETVGGVIIPRGGSLISLDLRKTILRPAAGSVPAPADEAADYSNRRCILRMTGEGYYYGFTFMDEAGNSNSHHLMSAYEFCSQAQLDEFYTKLDNAFGSLAAANLSTPASRDTEWQIVGPQPAVGSLTKETDTTASASPYIYNCSIRSEYGLCGLFANGAGVGGFRSCVLAQYTGVSLQNDYTSWQRYNGGTWGPVANFTEYRTTDPDDIRMNPNRRSFHIRALNGAVIQEVSVFAIGQGVHHWAESGADISCTNSNSNFGGCAALAQGYKAEAPPQDTGYAATHQRVPTDLTEKTNNIRQIFIGTIASTAGNTDTTIQLDSDVVGLGDDYTLDPGSYVWVESPTTADYRAQLGTQVADDSIVVTAAVQTDSADGNYSPGDPIPGTTTGQTYPDIAGRRVYVRRLIDTRTQDERRYALLFDPLATARLPQRDYILRTAGDGVGNAGTIDTAVIRAGTTKLSTTNAAKVQVELKQINPNQSFRTNSVYRLGDSIVANNKHYVCTKQFTSGASLGASDLVDYFSENFVHMKEGSQGNGYMPEDYFKNTQPVLIFDGDADELEASTDLGWVLDQSVAGNVWTGSNAAAQKIQGQFQSATDYRGLERYLTSKGLTIAAPRPAASRDIAITTQLAQEFRRPSFIGLYGQTYQWSGFGNYTKGLPQYQGGMLDTNKFTYYGTSELGGRVYFTGFNEEGFNVSPRGVEDIQTGELLSAEQINAPDVGLDIPTEFQTLKVGNLDVTQKLTVNGQLELNNIKIPLDNIEALPESEINKKGIASLASFEDVTASVPTAGPGSTTAEKNAAINEDAKIVTPTALGQWRSDLGLLQGIGSADVVVLHVCRDAANIRTGNASLPFGIPTDDGTVSTAWTADGTKVQDVMFTNVTDALARAAEIYTPVGAVIYISVHDDLSNSTLDSNNLPVPQIFEEGPLQLLNGTTNFVIAGCRTPQSGQVPGLAVRRSTTKSATARIPQYFTLFSYSAGAVFADIAIRVVNEDALGSCLTFDGGFGVGGADVFVTINQPGAEFALATSSYGGTIRFEHYGEISGDDLTNLKFECVLIDSQQNCRLKLFGPNQTGVGLIGSATNLALNFRRAGVGGTGNGTFTFAFDSDSPDTFTHILEMVDLGNRGAVNIGSRIEPIVDYDFSSQNLGQCVWDLRDFVTTQFMSRKNYHGPSFRTRQVASGSTVNAQYGLNQDSTDLFIGYTAQELNRGSCLDLMDWGSNDNHAGFYGLWLAMEGQAITGGTMPATLIEANNASGSYIWGVGVPPARNVTGGTP